MHNFFIFQKSNQLLIAQIQNPSRLLHGSNYVRHNSDVIMGAMTSQITNLAIIYSTVYTGADQRRHPRFTSLAFVRGQ